MWYLRGGATFGESPPGQIDGRWTTTDTASWRPRRPGRRALAAIIVKEPLYFLTDAAASACEALHDP